VRKTTVAAPGGVIPCESHVLVEQQIGTNSGGNPTSHRTACESHAPATLGRPADLLAARCPTHLTAKNSGSRAEEIWLSRAVCFTMKHTPSKKNNRRKWPSEAHEGLAAVGSTREAHAEGSVRVVLTAAGPFPMRGICEELPATFRSDEEAEARCVGEGDRAGPTCACRLRVRRRLSGVGVGCPLSFVLSAAKDPSPEDAPVRTSWRACRARFRLGGRLARGCAGRACGDLRPRGDRALGPLGGRATGRKPPREPNELGRALKTGGWQGTPPKDFSREANRRAPNRRELPPGFYALQGKRLLRRGPFVMDYRARLLVASPRRPTGRASFISSARALVRYAPEGLSLPVRSLAGGASSTRGPRFREGSPPEKRIGRAVKQQCGGRVIYALQFSDIRRISLNCRAYIHRRGARRSRFPTRCGRVRRARRRTWQGFGRRHRGDRDTAHDDEEVFGAR
jgi:hypothetical protein